MCGLRLLKAWCENRPPAGNAQARPDEALGSYPLTVAQGYLLSGADRRLEGGAVGSRHGWDVEPRRGIAAAPARKFLREMRLCARCVIGSPFSVPPRYRSIREAPGPGVV